MKHRVYNLFPIALLALMAGVSVWLERITEQEHRVKSAESSQEPSFIVDKLTLRRFDLSGKVQYVLVADHMTHYGNREFTELANPRLDYLNRPEPVQVVADKAEVDKNGEVIHLTGKVLVKRDAHADKPESTLRSEAMTIWPDDEKMRSEVPVTLTQGQSVVNALRMDSDNLTGIVHLDGQVRGTLYRIPPTSKP